MIRKGVQNNYFFSSLSKALWATSTVNSTPSNVFLALVLIIHCPCICNSSTSARSTGAGSTGAINTKSKNGTSARCNVLPADKDDRDVRNKHFVILLHNFKDISDVLSQIWKRRKSRVFGANFLGEKFGWCYIFCFLQLWLKANKLSPSVVAGALFHPMLLFRPIKVTAGASNP